MGSCLIEVQSFSLRELQIAPILLYFGELSKYLYTVILGFVKNVLRGFPPLCKFSVLDGAACRLGGLGEVDDVRSVLGVALVVPILLRGFV